MSAELISAQLSEYLRFKNGKSSPDRDDEAPFPVYGSNGLIGHADKINSDQNTIIIGRVGSYCGSVHFSDKPCWVSDNAIICTSKNPEDSLFWYYFLTFSDLNQYRSGSGQPLLNQGTLNSISCEVPRALTERVRIGEILASFDKKQGLNHQINQTLEQMTQAIFKSWFVDFEPVKAKIATLEAGGSEEDSLLAAMQTISGKGEAELTRLQTEQPEQYAELSATAELFPSAMQESEVGEIPEGWSVSEIGPHASVVDCLHSKKPQEVEHDSGKILLQLFNIRDDGLIDLDRRYHISDEDYQKWTSRIEVEEGDIVITNVGRVGASAIIPRDLKAAIGRNMTAVRANKSKVTSTYLITFLTSPSAKREIERNTDVGTILNALNVKSIPKLKFVSGSDGVLAEFERKIHPLLKLRQNNLLESYFLGQQRETLLPKLLSGELSMPNDELSSAAGKEPANV